MSDKTAAEKKTSFPVKAGDVVIIALVLAAAAALSAVFAFGQPAAADGGFAVISTPDGRTEYPLCHDAVIPVGGRGHTLTAIIENGGIRVTESDCPDGICVGMGRVSKPGEMIVCVPAGVIITVRGGGAEGFDAVAG